MVVRERRALLQRLLTNLTADSLCMRLPTLLEVLGMPPHADAPLTAAGGDLTPNGRPRRERILLRHAAPAAILPVAQSRGVAVLMNDSAALAKRSGCDGVHLGQQDGDPVAARKLLGAEATIGVTCHDSRHLAMEAGEAGADYVAFGAFFPTSTKETLHKPEPEILTWWSEMFEIPCVAIGGITAANCAPLVRAGADFLAVVGAVWNHPDGPAAVGSSRAISCPP
jgi:thiamine-phosphate pyrophosphorylase